jgi:hypothetical protein
VIGVLAGVGLMIFGYSYYNKKLAGGSGFGGFGGFGGGGDGGSVEGGMEKGGFSELMDDDDDAQL